MVWVDNASQVDILFYEPYADIIAEIAQNPSYKPLTIGVFGIWGAGKSTLLNLVEKKIPDRVDGHENICVKINAWTFEGYEDAKIAVIECLLRELKEKAPEKFKSKFVSLLKKLDFFKLGTKAVGIGAPLIAGLASGNPLSVLLGIEASAEGVAKGVKELSSAIQTVRDDYLKDDKSQSEESLVNNIRKFRDQFEKTLLESDINNVIVLIDDLDRCQPDRIIDTLEAIKLFLSVSKTVFIIAADENVIQYAIKRKYPPIDNYAVNLDKEYIEKIIQLPIYIPELSPKDIENYMMLLVAQEYCSPDNFNHIIAKIREEKLLISEDLIDFTKMQALSDGYILAGETEKFLEMVKIVDGIKGIISGNLKGNPRQAKRFLNTFVTKQKLAELYYGSGKIEPNVLAKLLVLQKLNPSLFITLNEWNKQFTIRNEQFYKMRHLFEGDVWPDPIPDPFKPWADPAIIKWIKCEPVDLETKRLDRYFYLTRENLQKAEVDVSIFSSAAKNILDRIGIATKGTFVKIADDLKELSETDINNVFQIVLPKISKGEFDFFYVQELYTKFEGYREQIFTALYNIEFKITLRHVPPLTKIWNADQEKINTLFEHWKARGLIKESTIAQICGFEVANH